MTKATNLHKRGNIYYGRVAVPGDLRDLRQAAGAPNPREIWRSLATTDLKTADHQLSKFKVTMREEFDRELAELQTDGIRPLTHPAAHELAQIRDDFYHEELRLDEFERDSRKSHAEIEVMQANLTKKFALNMPATDWELFIADGVIELQVARGAAEWSAEKRKHLKAALQEQLLQSNYVLVSDVIEYVCHVRGFDLSPDSLAYKSLARGLIKAWLKALDVAEARDRGVYDEDALVRAPLTGGGLREEDGGRVVDMATKGSNGPAKEKTMSVKFDAYVKEEKGQLNRNDQMNLRATCRQFIECNGDLAVSAYGKNEMATYKKGLQKYPANAAKLYPGMKFNAVIEQNKVDGNATLSSNTVRGKLSSLAMYGKWLAENETGIDAGSFSTSLPKRNDRERMSPFSPDDVRKVLNSYAFTGCEAHNNYQKPGEYKLRDWRYWLTLMSAFTGARLNEIMQMEVADVLQVNGIWAFDITDEGEGQSLKTTSSKRLLPVHPRLIDLGLLDYREALVGRGAKFLFDELPIGTNGRRSEAAGRWFRRFLRQIGVKQKGDLGGTHRCRHTLADELRRADVTKYDVAATLGHQINVAKMTGDYGIEMDMTLEKRHENLSRAVYASVDFDLLR